MSERTLTEELQSVLRAHALDAPKPEATIAAILAETAAASGGARWPLLAVSHRLSAARARWRAANKATLVAASIFVAIGLLAVGVRSLGTDSSSKSASSAAAGSAAAAAPLRSDMGSGQFGGPANGGAAGTTGETQSGAAASAGPAPTTTNNATVPRFGVVLECPRGQTGTSKAVATLDAPALKAYEFRLMQLDCVSANGVRTGSDLSVYRTGPAGPAKFAQVIQAAQGITVDSVVVADSTTAAGVTRLSVIGERQGATEQLTYAVSADRRTYTPIASEQLTRACANADVALIVVPVLAGEQPGRAGLVRVLNTSASACNVAGYPGLAPDPATVLSAGKFVNTLRGVLGGVKAPTYSTIRLAPGGVATALVEAATTSRCAVTTALQVVIGPGQPAVAVPFKISTCALRVHPFVAGETGSD